MPQSNAAHMSPRWGFRYLVYPVCYTHAAPLGLKNLRYYRTRHIALLPDKIGIQNWSERLNI